MPQKTAKSVWRRFLRKFRAILIAGLVVIIPLGVTIWIIIWLFNSVDNLLQPLVKLIVGHNITGVGFGVMAALILVVGIITTNVVGKRFIHWSESLLARVPITRVLYVAIRQIVQSFTEPNKTGFMQVVLVEFPAKGMKTIAFITNEETDKNGEKFFNVFIPTAFNPTGGFLEIVREEDIIRTNLSVEEALKMAVSAGRMSPQGLGDSLMRADSQDKSNEQKAK